MEYNKLRKKINKFYIGGKIQKLDLGGNLTLPKPILNGSFPGQQSGNYIWDGNSWVDSQFYQAQQNNFKRNNLDISDETKDDEIDNGFDEDEYIVGGAADKSVEEDHERIGKLEKKANAKSALSGIGQQISGVNFSENASWRDSGLSEGGAMGMGIVAKAGTAAVNAIDQATMGDKNFGAQSQAIDSAVHGISGALMSSGNPYAMIAGAALEGANFLTKAGGQTVQGYDVNIENSGYGNLGHMESSSSRDFGAMIGLGGLFNRGAMDKKLARRNEQARMALQAAEISEDVKFEQEARMNSVDNVLRNNLIALAGGIDTSLLGS